MTTLFFSYSHKDEVLRNELEEHLAMLKNDGTITTWHDRRITAGAELDEEILSNLESADVILLLVSASFLASNYCFHQEMTRALVRHKEGSAVVIPVILHPCDWLSSSLQDLRATPTDGKAVSMFGNQHEAFAIITKDIRDAIAARIRANGAHPAQTRGVSTQVGAIQTASHSGPRSSNLRLKKKFDDHERDQFLEDSYEYIARFFDGSLQELAERNPHIRTRFKRRDATSFSASVYENGNIKSACSIWYGGNGGFGGNTICYSTNPDSSRNSMNESVSVEEDGYALHLKPMGFSPFYGSRNNSGALTQQGAAEYLWSMLIGPMQ